ncbi:lysine-sensitive aspartokinase 3, partial [bacterium]
MLSKTLNVLKFGGTSVQDAKTINQVYEIISKNEGKQVIVVSAHSGVTNMLVEICNNNKE